MAKGAKYRDGAWRWPDGTEVEFPDLPDEPPDDWVPDPWNESLPAWETCAADAPGAIKVWLLEERER